MKFEDYRICATCRFWKGNKQKVKFTYAEYPISIDLQHGWPEDGYCSEIINSINIELLGDAIVKLTTDANFWCVRYETDKTD